METILIVVLWIILIVAIGLAAKWIIETFFPAPIQLPVQLLVGVLLLLILLVVVARTTGLSLPALR